MHDYKALKVWQESLEFSIEIYDMTDHFPEKERFSLIPQMTRAAVSIASNIAEGAGRQSPKEFINFLSIANGSACELDTQPCIAYRRNYITEVSFKKAEDKINYIQKMIFNLQQSMKQRLKNPQVSVSRS